MSAPFSDFLAAHADRITDVWARGLSRRRSGDSGAGEHEPRQLVNAVLVALTADDIRPLIAYYELDQPGFEDRLGRAMSDMASVRHATAEVAREHALDPTAALALAMASADELDALARRLAEGCVGALATRLQSATGALNARGASLSITIHELRRPLTILNSYGQLLSAGMLGEIPETAQVAIEGITASTEMLVRMVNALAEVARLEDPEDRLFLEVLKAGELVDAAVEQVAMEAKLRNAELRAAVEADPEVRGDRRRLILALTNLLGNAVKHGPPESVIEVSVHGDRDSVHFVVRDRGPGFPAADAERLFEKYFRSVDERHRKIPGSGLGLYIVKTVAERHHGTVAAHSTPGEGAEFEMIIPMHKKTR